MLDTFTTNKINAAKAAFQQLEAELNAGMSSVERLKEYSKLASIIELADKYDKATTDMLEVKVWYNEETDPDTKEVLADEYSTMQAEVSELEIKILDAMVEKEKNDDCPAIFEISGQVGGEEANLFARDLYDMYYRYISAAGFHIEIIAVDETKLGGFNFVSFRVTGENAYGIFKYESGVHRVQRVPETEAKGRIHTSTASVMVTPEVDASKFELDLNDVEITACHSSGAGGQNVNKVSSAIRVVYKPTGLMVFCQQHRDQPKNKEEALRILASKLQAERDEKEAVENKENRMSKLGNRDRSDKIRTYNFPENRFVDHRINYKTNTLDKILQGDLDDLLRALRIASARE